MIMTIVVVVLVVLILVRTGSIGKALGFLMSYIFLPAVLGILGGVVGFLITGGDDGKLLGFLLGAVIGFIMALKGGINSARGG